MFDRLNKARTAIMSWMVILAIAVAGCATPEPGSPEAVYQEQQEKKEAHKEAVKQSIEEAPDWFINPPQDAKSVYSSGTSTSPDLQLALDKAILSAKRSLADRINGLLSSKMKEFVAETGGGEDKEVISEVERVTTNLITEVNVAGYQQKDAKVLTQGEKYRAYVLLQYPLGKANRILIDQVQKNRILESKMRASKAFKELEDDIKRMSGGS